MLTEVKVFSGEFSLSVFFLHVFLMIDSYHPDIVFGMFFPLHLHV